MKYFLGFSVRPISFESVVLDIKSMRQKSVGELIKFVSQFSLK